jgi:probable HAF family extracellular repeat protein
VGQSPGPDDFVSGEAILWPRGGAPIRLGLIGGNTISAARAINDAGVVVGWMRGSAFNKVPFRWSADRGMELLPTLGNGGAADGINNDGYIVGTVYSQPNSSAGHAALWTPDGEMIDLGTLAGGRSEATDINSHLQVSGDATDANGLSHVVRWDVSILVNHPPIVDARGPYTGLEGSPVVLNGSATDQDNDITNVAWQFGDGSTGVGAVSTHTYLDNGTYSATLTATDSHGLTGTSTATVIIANVPPSVHVSSVSSLTSGQDFELTATFSDPGIRDMPWVYRIDWGVGSPTTGSTNSQDVPIVSLSPRYCAAGDYTVLTTITDKDNGAGTATTSLHVSRIDVPLNVLTGTINPRAQGELPVAILSTSTFDAREVDVASVTLGDGQESAVSVARHPNGRLFASFEDVNHDARPDLVLHFQRKALAALGILNAPETTLWLFGRLSDGCREIAGHTEVRVLSNEP